MTKRKRKPKFRVGQVVSVYPCFESRHLISKHGMAFGKVVKVEWAADEDYAYFLDGWTSPLSDSVLRALTERESR
jgi:hypothetical protein